MRSNALLLNYQTDELNTGKVLHEVAMVNMVKPHGSLVPVSFNHYWSFTSGLSTSWSRRGL